MADRVFMENEDTWVGRFVYQNFKPQRVGKIEEILPQGNGRWKRVRVKWEDGTSITAEIQHFRDFESLIEEHAVKVAKHRLHLENVRQKLEG